jgi:hypothetical protein
MTPFTLAVTGGRDYSDSAHEFRLLDEIHAAHPVTELCQGGASGADRFAKVWAESRGVACQTFVADWDAHGNAAGPMRNKRMCDYVASREGRKMLLALPGNRGTADCVGKFLAAGIEVRDERS